ncbi:MAG TPA: cytochrome c oxidase assembly protein [Gemmatimonadaceae bacterium]|nr:cytochrome c oxidase assembly protein [Gemmatimonadaceae bacterium]
MTRAPLHASLLLVAGPAVARAHPGQPVEPHDLWRAWSTEPLVIALLVASALLYARGFAARRHHAGTTRAPAAWRAHAYAAALATLVIALLSPVDALGGALFAGHMVQHLLLTMVAAPLLVLGDPGTSLLWALPIDMRRRMGLAWRRAPTLRAAWRALGHPLTAWSLHFVALVAWHVPTLYERAVRDDAVHALEHASFFVTALLFWWVVAAPRPRQRMGTGLALLYLFTSALASTILGALITMATVPWYTVHARSALAWGVNALEDQQLAGLIMWVPAGLVYVGAALALGVELLREPAVGRS